MSTLNVLRYSALGAGIAYGAIHRYNLYAAEEQKQVLAKWKSEEKLIKQAKAEYAKLNPPVAAASSGSINWEDPNLDFGQALESLIAKLD